MYRPDWAFISIYLATAPVHYDEAGAELKGKAFDLLAQILFQPSPMVTRYGL